MTTQTKPFDPTVYAPLITELWEAVLDYRRQTAPLQREAAWNKCRDARDKVIAAEDSMVAKMNRLEGKLKKYEHLPEEQRPAGYERGMQNWINALDAYETLNAARRCVQIMGRWNTAEEEGE